MTIWDIADDVLRAVYMRGKYRDVILPMTVIRRLDAVLELTRNAALRQAFYNTLPFRLRDLVRDILRGGIPGSSPG